MTGLAKMDRPILFSAPMVNAILAGRKTQTRRVAKCGGNPFRSASGVWMAMNAAKQAITEMRCPYGKAGDKLWVRETWAHYQTINSIRRYDGASSSQVSDGRAGYKADGFDTIEEFREHIRAMSGLDLEEVEINGNRWRPSIHMPRWASRIALQVTGVRLERLHDIKHADAAAEGWPGADDKHINAVSWYAELWDHINGKKVPWDLNPRVWVLEFQSETDGDAK